MCVAGRGSGLSDGWASRDFWPGCGIDIGTGWQTGAELWQRGHRVSCPAQRGLCSFHKPHLSSGAMSRSGAGVGISEGTGVLHLPASVGAAKGPSCIQQGQGKDATVNLAGKRGHICGRPVSLGLCASLAWLEITRCQGEVPGGRAAVCRPEAMCWPGPICRSGYT